MSDKNPGVPLADWTGGANSLLPPDRIAASQYSWGVNIVNRGGIIQTRPGFDDFASLLGKTPQGGTIFVPKDGRPMMLVAIDGLIYSSKFPFHSFTKVEGLKFVATAPIITFQRCNKSVKLNPDGSLSIIDPKAIVVIQDNETLPGVFDGEKGIHSVYGSPSFGIPIGLWMASRIPVPMLAT
jgi:hypothetical protein